MKISFIPFLVVGLMVFVTVACRQNDTSANAQQQPATASDTTSNGDVFTTEASEYESADRVIWQKPDLIIQQLGDVEGKVVADLGAGTGYFSRRMAYKGAKVIAIDIDPRAIQWMEEQKNRFPVELQDRLIIRQAEENDPKLRPDEVDMILLVNTYSYIQNRVAYFTNLKSVIRSGGFILIIDFKKKDTPFGPPFAERVDVAEVERELREAGYSVLKVDEEALEYQYIIKAARK